MDLRLSGKMRRENFSRGEKFDLFDLFDQPILAEISQHELCCVDVRRNLSPDEGTRGD